MTRSRGTGATASNVLATAIAASVSFGSGCSSRPAVDPSRPAQVVAAVPASGAPAGSRDDAASLPPATPLQGSSGNRIGPKGRALVARMVKRVEAARGLQAKKEVPGVVLERTDLIGRVRAHVAKEVPPQAITNEGNVLKIFGFVPTSYDYLGGTFKMLESQLAGYYEPADGTMYMAGDLDEDTATATLAHELVHALQDQFWDLKSQSHYEPGKSDASSARSALAEGDATSAMSDVMLALSEQGGDSLALPDDRVGDLMMAGVMASDDGAPDVMKRGLVAPYIDGMKFVNALRRKGGWRAVDAAWASKPTTTEQILHVDKWLAHEAALPVPVPAPDVLGSGYTAIDTDSLGELGVRLMFEQWMDVPTAKVHAANWGGDASVLAGDGDRRALLVRVRYDAAAKDRAAHAKGAWASLEAKLPKRLGAPKLRDPSNLLCFERPEVGPLVVARRDRDLIVVAGPTTVAAKGPWSPAGTCDRARAILDAMAATK
ncbi:MAG: hypothetical protein U0169_16905 [Polyangiaceae bacterium]